MSFDSAAFLRRAIGTPSHDDVSEMRSLLVSELLDLGFRPEMDDAGNVRATRGSATSDGTHIVLNTHLDTVHPHIGYQRDGAIIRGRGACDAKGSLAAMVAAFCAVDIDDGQVTLAVTPNEETSQHGGAYLGEHLAADGYIVGEPTGLDVCIAARGNFGGYISIVGESAHASTPGDGTNPLRVVGDVLDVLDRYDDNGGLGSHKVLGMPDLEPTQVEAGGPLNQIPRVCTIGFDRRTVPPERIEQFVADLESYLIESLPSSYHYEVLPAYPESPTPEAFATSPDSPLVQTLASVSGGEVRPFTAATEASYFADTAPTVVFGPGVLEDDDGPVAHSEREYVRLSAVEDATAILCETLERVF